MSLILGLWSIVLEPGKTFSQNTTPGIQITNIAFGPEIKGDARSVVTVKYPEFEQDSDDEDEDEEDDEDEVDSESGIKLPKLITKEAVLAILKPNVTEQVSINVSLVEDVEMVEFSVTGSNPVHLIGHYIRQEDFDQDPYSDSDNSEYDSNDEDIPSDFEEDESASDLEGMSGLIADGSDDGEDGARFEELKQEIAKHDEAAKSALLVETRDTRVKGLLVEPRQDFGHKIPIGLEPPSKPPIQQNGHDDGSAGDTSDSPSHSAHEDSDIAAAPASAPASTKPMSKSARRRSKKRAAAAEADASADVSAAADESMSSTLSKNQKKKLAKKQKLENGDAAAPAAAAAPVAEKKAAVAEKPKAEEKKKPAARVLAGGLQVVDAKLGEGPGAKNGTKIGMRYIGKLENGKVFDSNTKGAPLTFTLGRGEVIKGWDQGLVGLQVGGERKLTIPAALAYGKKGTNGIPGNATLIFDVKRTK